MPDNARRLFDAPDLVLAPGYPGPPDTVASRTRYERLGVIVAVARTADRIAAGTTPTTGPARDSFRVLVEDLSAYGDTAGIAHRAQNRSAGWSGAARTAAPRRRLEACFQLRGPGGVQEVNR